MSRRLAWITFAYCNCFLASAKWCSGILRTVELLRRQLQDLLPLCRLRIRPLLFRGSVCLFPVSSLLIPTLSRWCVFSFSAAYQPLSLPVFPRFSLRDPVTMIKRIPGFPGKLTQASRKSSVLFFVSFPTSPSSLFLSLSHSFFLSSHLILKHIEFSTKI